MLFVIVIECYNVIFCLFFFDIILKKWCVVMILFIWVLVFLMYIMNFFIFEFFIVEEGLLCYYSWDWLVLDLKKVIEIEFFVYMIMVLMIFFVVVIVFYIVIFIRIK